MITRYNFIDFFPLTLIPDLQFFQIYESTSIWSFHNLVTHQGSDKQAPELMMQSLAAIFLLRCLKAKNYYPVEPNSDPSRLSEEELYLALLLHHFMRVTYYNTHEITTTDEDTNGVGFGTDRLAMRRIGRATNPTLALLNHTCDPNYRRISVGRQVSSFLLQYTQSKIDFQFCLSRLWDSLLSKSKPVKKSQTLTVPRLRPFLKPNGFKV